MLPGRRLGLLALRQAEQGQAEYISRHAAGGGEGWYAVVQLAAAQCQVPAGEPPVMSIRGMIRTTAGMAVHNFSSQRFAEPEIIG